jgi:cytochrome c oxidase subunit 2
MMNLCTLAQTFLLPRQASNLARDVDWAWNVVLGVTGFFFCLVVVVMLLFVLKYRRRTPTDSTPEITHNTPLEIIWTVVPLVLLIVFFFVGFKGFLNYDTPPSNAVVVDVQGQKWNFTFTYPNGGVSDVLYVQQNVPVVLNLHSVDVLHALYIPAFRTQRNLVPYRTTNIWFIPEQLSPKEGFPIFCTQYCGKDHSRMRTVVQVLDKKDFDEAMTQVANPFKEKNNETGKTRWVPYVKLGEKFYNQMGCITCHTTNGTKGTGPTWQGLWKRDHAFAAVDEAGYTLKAGDDDAKWEAYLTQSMVHPSAKVVSGFQDQMPSFAAQLSGSVAKDEKARAIMTYIKSLGSTGWKPPLAEDADAYDADKHPEHHPEFSPEHVKALESAATGTGGAASAPAANP